MPDTEDPFIPYPPEKLGFDLATQKEHLENLLDKLLVINHAENVNKHGGVCYASAASIGRQLLENTGGRIISFLSKIPTIGVGALTGRTD
jgi:protein transport protein SEC24